MKPKDNEIVRQFSRPRLFLASASPRRLQLLTERGLKPKVIAPQVDESLKPRESPQQYASRLALKKARTVARKLSKVKRSTFVLAADTVVSLKKQIFGKPANKAEARAFLRQLSKKTHHVTTGYVLLEIPDKIIMKGTVQSDVTMKGLSEEEIRAYVNTGESMDKAGAYAAQGRGAKLIEKIQGSTNNVIGLPVEELEPWFKKVGLKKRKRVK